MLNDILFEKDGIKPSFFRAQMTKGSVAVPPLAREGVLP
jgi:hypothetical protein